MVHTYKIVKPLEINYQGVFDFKEFLNVIKDLFKRYDADLSEKAYNTSADGGVKNTNMAWEFDKKVDDYNQVFVKLKINLLNYKEGYVDSKKVVDGSLNLIIEAEVQRDYDQKWKTSPIKKMARAMYDKYVDEPRHDKVADDLKKTVDNLKREVKQYLHI